MRRALVLGALGLFALTLSHAIAATNLNSSRSNIYRLTYPATLVSRPQADAILAELDKLGPAEEITLKKWLAANFKRHGVRGELFKKIVVLRPDKDRKEIAILLLSDPADEAAAVAVTVKSSKSNSSD